MERDYYCSLVCRLDYHFNSHAHVERDNNRRWGLQDWYISTHTLTWSVTLVGLNVLRAIYISTHTLTWSVTNRAIKTFALSSHFNSHAHVERDGRSSLVFQRFSHFNSHAHVERDKGTCHIEFTDEISTHTLTWSVTSR